METQPIPNSDETLLRFNLCGTRGFLSNLSHFTDIAYRNGIYLSNIKSQAICLSRHMVFLVAWFLTGWSAVMLRVSTEIWLWCESQPFPSQPNTWSYCPWPPHILTVLPFFSSFPCTSSPSLSLYWWSTDIFPAVLCSAGPSVFLLQLPELNAHTDISLVFRIFINFLCPFCYYQQATKIIIITRIIGLGFLVIALFPSVLTVARPPRDRQQYNGVLQTFKL